MEEDFFREVIGKVFVRDIELLFELVCRVLVSLKLTAMILDGRERLLKKY